MNVELPTATKHGLTFYPVPDFNDASCVFGADRSQFFNRGNLPNIPRDFRNLASRLFFSGGEIPHFDSRIDRGMAIKAIRAWLSSWDPPHEAKEATVAYAIWLWTSKEALDAAADGEEA